MTRPSNHCRRGESMPSNDEIFEAVASIESPFWWAGRWAASVSSSRSRRNWRQGEGGPPPSHRQSARDALNDRLQRVLEPYGRGADVTVEVMTEQMAIDWIGKLRQEVRARAGRGRLPDKGAGDLFRQGRSGQVVRRLQPGGLVPAKWEPCGNRGRRHLGLFDPRMLGVTEPPVLVGEAIVPPTAHGVKVMSMDYFVGDDKAVIWRGPMLHKAIEQFLKDVFWDTLDFLIVDMPPGTGDIAISMSQFLPRAQVLLVTTPTAHRTEGGAASGLDGGRGRPAGHRGGGEHVLVHRRTTASAMSCLEAEAVPRWPPSWGWTSWPRSRSCRRWGGADEGHPVSIAAPGSEAAEAFDALAKAVVDKRPRIRTNPALVIN